MKQNSSHFKPGNKQGKRFKPGKSGNPKGAPKGKRVVTRIKEYLAKKEGDLTNEQKLIAALFEKAFAGDVRAINTIIDRVDGKVAQTVVLKVELDGFNQELLNDEQLTVFLHLLEIGMGEKENDEVLPGAAKG